MNGHIPHFASLPFRCPRCGGELFKSYPQTAPTDKSQIWTWEFVCNRCGQSMNLTVQRCV